MEGLDALTPEVKRLFSAKERRRRELASLPFPEKVRIVVQLQQMALPLFKGRGRNVRVWCLDR